MKNKASATSVRFKAKRIDNGEEIIGYYIYNEHSKNHSIGYQNTARTISQYEVDPSTVELIGEKEIGLKYVREFWEKLKGNIVTECITHKDIFGKFLYSSVRKSNLTEQAEKLIKEIEGGSYGM